LLLEKLILLTPQNEVVGLPSIQQTCFQVIAKDSTGAHKKSGGDKFKLNLNSWELEVLTTP